MVLLASRFSLFTKTHLIVVFCFQNATVTTSNKETADRRMNKTIMTIILLSLACYLPQFCVLVFLSIHKRTAWHIQYMIPWVYIFTFATPAITTFVYCWKNRQLQNEMIKCSKRFFPSFHSIKKTTSSSTINTSAS